MSEYRFENISPLNEASLLQDTFIWIWYADKIPPHLGISVNGAYFSLKYNGKDVALDVSKTMKIIKTRNIASLFIKVNLQSKVKHVSEVFESFDKASSQGETCLQPIQKALDIAGCETLFDLLNKLALNQLIQTISGLNLPMNYKGIPLYGKEEIRSRLLKLEHATLGKHIPTVG